MAYKQDDYLGYCLSAIYPHVDLIEVMQSDRPFTAYNPMSRHEFMTPDKTLEILQAFPDTHRKMHITVGEWADEESMRKEATDNLRRRGASICLIIDADEFWPDGLLESCIAYMHQNLEQGQVAWSRYKTLFKRVDRLVDFPGARLPIAFECHSELRFIDRRVPAGDRIDLPQEFYYWHLGYVLSDERMYEKIHTFSHAHEVPSSWYQDKWIQFSDDTTDLCRKDPKRWPRTVSLNPWELPTILHMHPFFWKIIP